MVRPMVHSTKHYVQLPFNDITTGTREINLIVRATESTQANAATEVREGSTVKAIYFEMWIQNSGVDGVFIATITKDMELATGPSFGEQANLFAYTNKKNILWTSQGLTSNDGISGPVNIIRGWVKIPKSKQRFGLGDSINMNISNTSAGDLHRCGFALFKEYS